MRPHRSLAVVASLPSRCALCQGEERMRIHPPAEPHTAVAIDCPHCAAGHHPISILTLPMRQGQPSGGAA